MVFLPVDFVEDFIELNTQMQIAGFDLTVKEIYSFKSVGKIDFDNTKRVLPEYNLVPLENDRWQLSPGGYLVRYNEIIKVPDFAVGLLLPRSSLMRCGATIHSALWDPGYIGKGVGLLIVTTPIIIYRNARIAQIIFIKTETQLEKTYTGQYQNEGIELLKEKKEEKY
ncbi:MAG: deoxyuridine 5'-triphosphate nucleotidohydrolase [Candidatus Heimdallarchaeaceae archaeon]